jgi:hypothetical protein
VFAGDVGVGIGHQRFDRGPFDDLTRTGVGMNLEGSLGVTDRLELGLRTGFRFGQPEDRSTRPDNYARTLWTETWGTGTATVANPEFRLRWVAHSGSVAEVGLDGRIFMPVENGTRFGLMFGVPLAFHLASFMRIDTGAYIPIVFYSPTFNGITIPAYFWFQPSEKLWLGPMLSVRFIDTPGAGSHEASLLLGFGLGYQVASAVDLKTMILFPQVDNDFAREIGAGFGAQFRIGD